MLELQSCSSSSDFNYISTETVSVESMLLSLSTQITYLLSEVKFLEQNAEPFSVFFILWVLTDALSFVTHTSEGVWALRSCPVLDSLPHPHPFLVFCCEVLCVREKI